jgi:tetratricopeptide (TPR) repeat protein
MLAMHRSALPIVLTAVIALSIVPSTAVMGAALSPDMQADQYLVAAKRQLDAGNLAAAVEYFKKILALKVAVPAELYYHYGKTLASTGALDEAGDMLGKYLTLAGKSGQFYLPALEQLAVIDERKAAAEAKDAAATEARRAALRDGLTVGAMAIAAYTETESWPLSRSRHTGPGFSYDIQMKSTLQGSTLYFPEASQKIYSEGKAEWNYVRTAFSLPLASIKDILATAPGGSVYLTSTADVRFTRTITFYRNEDAYGEEDAPREEGKDGIISFRFKDGSESGKTFFEGLRKAITGAWYRDFQDRKAWKVAYTDGGGSIGVLADGRVCYINDKPEFLIYREVKRDANGIEVRALWDDTRLLLPRGSGIVQTWSPDARKWIDGWRVTLTVPASGQAW